MRTGPTATALLVAVLSVSACSATTSTTNEPTAQVTSAGAGTSGTADTSVDGTIGVAENEVAPGASADSIDVLQEKTGLVAPGGDGKNDTVTVGVKSLTRDSNGTTMTLRLVFTPTFASAQADETISLFDINDPMYLLPTVLDRVHLKSYSVPHSDGLEAWLTSDGLGANARNGNSFEAWFTYATLEDEVDTVDVIVVDSWPTFTGIPVT